MGSVRVKWNGESEPSAVQQAVKRRLLLREAAAAFNERGFHNVSLDEVAARLGISKTVCYYYFRDKNHLLLSCIEIGFELAENALKLAEATQGQGLDKVVELTRRYVEGLTSELGACAVVADVNSLQESDLKAVRLRQRAFGRRLEKLVQLGMSDGSIVAGDSRASASWIVSGPLMIPRLSGLWQKSETSGLAEKYAELARRSLSNR
jgi:AcrR family transcriptional regulator